MKKLAFIVLLAAGLYLPAHSSEVAVMMSKDVDPLREALKGFKDTARYRIVKQYNINGDLNYGRKVLEEIQSEVKPGVLFTLGAPALQVATGKRGDLAAVYSMVFNPARILGKGSRNITGVSMDVPAGQVIDSLKGLRPPVRRLGVLFNPASSGTMILELTLAARKRGIQLVDAGVNSRDQLPQALASLRQKIDALWILPDPTVLAPGVVDYILLWSYRNKIPVVGQAEQHTKKGALLSFSAGSNREMGRKAGELVTRILRGEKPATIRHVVSQPVRLTVNPKAAQKLGVVIPDQFLKRATNLVQAPVYEEGDWWVFRTSVDGRAQVHRVDYRDGAFHTDQPRFLLGETLTHRPWATFYFTDPARRWLDFPLWPGKAWSFRYPTEDLRRRDTIGEADAFAVGPTAKPVETAAGTFPAFEIERVDILNIWVKLSYFYSPETKSVVRLHSVTRGTGSSHTVFELELIDCGVNTGAGPQILSRLPKKE